MVGFLMTMLFFTIIYAISFVIAIPITKKRLCGAKRLVIGKETEERKEELRNIARDIILEHKIPDFMDGIEITISKKKNKITSIKMETEKTIVTLIPGGETYIIDKGFSEVGAIAVTALPIFAFFLIGIFFYVIMF